MQGKTFHIAVLQGFELFAKMMEVRWRLPYTRVKWLPGSVARVAFMMEITGVMPLPAAKAR